MSSRIYCSKGFSLIETAIGMVVAGLIIAGILAMAQAENADRRQRYTSGNLAKIETAINQYYRLTGAYPRPANLSFNEINPNYGKEESWVNAAAIPQCSSATWFSTNGICRTTADPNIAAVVGAVPFAALQLNIEDSLDGWDNKIIYVVTEVKTDPSRFSDNNGVITSQALDINRVPTVVDNLTDFVLFSTGETGRGGYGKDGIPIAPCGTMAQGFDNENCDFDSVFILEVNPNNLSIPNARSEVAGAGFYDDITEEQAQVPISTWFPSLTNNADIITLATRIGIGTTNPQVSIHVVGDIRVDSNIMSSNICDENNNNCFEPELITGTRPEMRCDNTDIMFGEQPMMEVANSKVGCASSVDAGGTLIDVDGKRLQLDMNIYNPADCYATGMLVTGFNASGDPICTVP